MRTLHTLLVVVYVAVPLVAAAIAIVLSRRQRNLQPLLAFLLNVFSATLLSTALCLSYAYFTDSGATVLQTLLLAYFLSGVMTLLKLVNWLFKEGAERLFFVHARQTPTGPKGVGWAVRLAGATLTRVVLLFAIGLPYIMALGMVYRPKVVGGDTPTQQLGTPYEEVTFESTDGVQLAGWWIPARPPRAGQRPATMASTRPASSASGIATRDDWGRKTVVLCHGLGAGKANQLLLARDLVDHGYNVLAFDFRAHGESGGQLSSFGDLERYDVLGAVRWLRQHRPQASGKIVGLGVSMGGAALLAAAAEPTDEGRAIDAIAVFSTYDDLGALAQDMVENHLIRPLAFLVQRIGIPLANAHVGTDLTAFVPARAAEKLAPRPLMVVHGRGDHLIPFDRGVRLYAAAPIPKLRLWVGELNREHEYVIRTNARYRVDENGISQPQPADGPPADHDHLIYYDDALKAVRLFFEEAMPMI